MHGSTKPISQYLLAFLPRDQVDSIEDKTRDLLADVAAGREVPKAEAEALHKKRKLIKPEWVATGGGESIPDGGRGHRTSQSGCACTARRSLCTHCPLRQCSVLGAAKGFKGANQLRKLKWVATVGGESTSCGGRGTGRC